MANMRKSGSRGSAKNNWPRAAAGSGMAGKAAKGEDVMPLPTLALAVFLVVPGRIATAMQIYQQPKISKIDSTNRL
jgi:hypothetical protein